MVVLANTLNDKKNDLRYKDPPEDRQLTYFSSK